MASPKKNSPYAFCIALVGSASGDFQINPTIEEGDFKVSTDGGGFASLATLPSVSPIGTVCVDVSLSADEMNGDKVVVLARDVAGDEWEDQFIFIETDEVNLNDLVRATTPGNALNISAGGLAEANILQLGGSDTALATLAALYDGAVVRGTVNTVNGIDDFTLTSAELSSNHGDYNSMWLVMLDGDNRFVPRLVGDYNGATKRVQFTGSGLAGGFPQSVSPGDAWMLLSGSL